MLHSFCLFGRTERPDRTGTNKILFDVDGHHRRWKWTSICRGMCKIYRSCRFGWRGPGFCMDPNTFFYIGTERMTTNSLVPFRPFPCFLVGVKTRPIRYQVYEAYRVSFCERTLRTVSINSFDGVKKNKGILWRCPKRPPNAETLPEPIHAKIRTKKSLRLGWVGLHSTFFHQHTHKLTTCYKYPVATVPSDS